MWKKVPKFMTQGSLEEELERKGSEEVIIYCKLDDGDARVA